MLEQIDFERFSKMIRIHVKSFFKLLDKASKEDRFYVDAQKKINYIKAKDEAAATELQGYLDLQKSGQEIEIKPTEKDSPPPSKIKVETKNINSTVAPIHLKGYEKALAKAKDNPFYIKELQSKIDYIAKKDSALAAEFQKECDKLKGAKDSSELARLLQLEVDKVQNCIDLCNSYDTVLEKQNYLNSARNYLKKVASLSKEKGAEYEQKIALLEQSVQQQKEQATEESELVATLSEQINYIKTGLLGQGIGDQINFEIENKINSYQSKINSFLNDEFLNNFNRLATIPIPPTAISSYTNYTNNLIANFNYKLNEIKDDLKKPTNHVHKAYELCLCLACELAFMEKIFPDLTELSSYRVEMNDILKELPNRKVVDTLLEANYNKFTDEAVMRKNRMDDPAIVQKVKKYFQEYKSESLGELLKIVIPYEVWEVKKNAFDIPIEKSLVIDLASEDTEENKFYIHSMKLKQTYEGGAYGPIHYGFLHEKIREIREANIDK